MRKPNAEVASNFGVGFGVLHGVTVPLYGRNGERFRCAHRASTPATRPFGATAVERRAMGSTSYFGLVQRVHRIAAWGLLTFASGFFCAACDDKPRPWGNGEGPALVLAPPARTTSLVPESSPNEANHPSIAPGAAPTETADPSGGLPMPTASSAPVSVSPASDEQPLVTPGGGWVLCREGLVLSGDPLKDVTRLGLMCGPSNGMRRKTQQALVGVLAENAPPVTTAVRLMRGACYRVFAAADETVGELEVTLHSSRDATIATGKVSERLSIVQPDRPFCCLEEDLATLHVRALRGSGRFAAEVWAIGERRRKGDRTEPTPDEPPLDESP